MTGAAHSLEIEGIPIQPVREPVNGLRCWRRVKTDQLCRLKIDQALSGAAYYAPVDKSTRLRWS
ncbi:MAG: hypothetical protein A3H91_11190 [Gammaproteobacteria bacterium RIFCSPLOWO2_02_FULL_61_13]|nr:MAG: hypothetical protein A3H91_11190 [Gammaproteobacteria bacterium RIFCSPLOWO2_02_FULL_61_13]